MFQRDNFVEVIYMYTPSKFHYIKSEELLSRASSDRNSFFNLKYALTGLTMLLPREVSQCEFRPDPFSSQPYDPMYIS